MHKITQMQFQTYRAHLLDATTTSYYY